MKQHSAGILCHKIKNNQLYVLLASAGGPYYEKKECWSIPKGIVEESESPLEAAKREFNEETGIEITGSINFLAEIIQSNAKVVTCFTVEQDADISNFSSNFFELEWPPQSGIIRSYPETKEIKWMTAEEAKTKIIKGQIPLIEKLEEYLKTNR